MSSSPPPPTRNIADAGLRPHHAYCRKQKSLGLLCSNFVSLYNRDGVDSVGLDDAARRLGVERRRIYDIVNVLESVGVLSRKAKNMYSWIGFSGIPKALDELKEDALREMSGCDAPNRKMVSEDDHDDNVDPNDEDDDENAIEEKLSQTANSSSSTCKTRSDSNRKEKSLGLLTQNFVKLFLTTDVDTISLDEAARILLGDINDVSYMRTKVRRLYDIANVLSSMNLIEKIQVEARKPAFRWLGVGGKPKTDSSITIAIAPAVAQPSKRAFGNDLTNVDMKRSRSSSAVDKKSGRVQVRTEDLKECNLTAQKQLGSKNGYVFGPFCPAGLIKDSNDVDDKPGKKVIDWETLASSFRPQYHNQALTDLFSHYVEAWKSWNRVLSVSIQKIKNAFRRGILPQKITSQGSAMFCQSISYLIS